MHTIGQERQEASKEFLKVLSDSNNKEQ